MFFFSSQEKRTVLDSYRRKAEIVVSMLRTLEGVVCNEINGSLYVFPSIKLPRKAVEAAKVRRFESSALHIDQKFSTFCSLFAAFLHRNFRYWPWFCPWLSHQLLWILLKKPRRQRLWSMRMCHVKQNSMCPTCSTSGTVYSQEVFLDQWLEYPTGFAKSCRFHYYL